MNLPEAYLQIKDLSMLSKILKIYMDAASVNTVSGIQQVLVLKVGVERYYFSFIMGSYRLCLEWGLPKPEHSMQIIKSFNYVTVKHPSQKRDSPGTPAV